MAQLTKKFIGDNQVADEKIRLDNNSTLRSRNAANSADIDIIKVNSSDQIQTEGDVVPLADNTYDLGSPSLNHVSVHTKNIESSTSINIQPAGGNILLQSASGVDVLDPTATAAPAVRFFNAAGTFSAGIKAPALSADYTLTLPTDDGTSGQVLSTDGSGVLSWTSGGGLSNPVPNNTWLQWEDDVASPVNIMRLNDSNILQVGQSTVPFQLESASASINSDGDININSQQKIVLSAVDALVELSPGGAGATELRFYDDDADFYTGIKAAGTTTASVTYVLPPDLGTAGQVLTDAAGDGVLSWTTPSGGGGTWAKETFTLISGDITAQKVTVANTPIAASVVFTVKGAGALFDGGANPDYSVSGSDINFLNDLATGGAAALVVGDIVQVQYQY